MTYDLLEFVERGDGFDWHFIDEVVYVFEGEVEIRASPFCPSSFGLNE